MVHDEIAPQRLQTPQVAPATPSIAPQGVTQVKWDLQPMPAQTNALQTVGYVAVTRR